MDFYNKGTKKKSFYKESIAKEKIISLRRFSPN